MGQALVLETTFLIDLERELARGVVGHAQAFLERHATATLSTTHTVLGEMAAGLPPTERYRWEQLLAPFEVLPCTSSVAWTYGQTYRYLQSNGLLIGANDLWIAATAIAYGKDLVTSNERDFGRVPGLRVISYRPTTRKK